MTKEQLILKLKEILPVMSKVGEYMDEIDVVDMRIQTIRHNASQPQKGNAVYYIIGFVIGFYAFGFVAMKLPLIKNIFMLFALAGGVLGVALVKKRTQKEKGGQEEEIENLKKRRDLLEEEWVSILAPYWDKIKAIVPEQYASPFFVKTAYTYLTSGRADSMKEAINLFEEEQHRNRMEQGIKDMEKQHRQEMQSMQDKLGELENRVNWAEHEARVARSYNQPY